MTNTSADHDENEDALLKAIDQNIEQFHKTTLYVAPLAALISYGVYMQASEVSVFGLQFGKAEAAIIITIMQALVLLYSARCLSFCIVALERSKNPQRIKEILRDNPSPANIFYQKIPIPIELSKLLNQKYINKSLEKLLQDEKLLTEFINKFYNFHQMVYLSFFVRNL